MTLQQNFPHSGFSLERSPGVRDRADAAFPTGKTDDDSDEWMKNDPNIEITCGAGERETSNHCIST